MCCGAGQELRQSLQGFAARRSRAARSHAPLNTISGFRGSVALHHFRKWAQTAPPGAESAHEPLTRTFRMFPPSTGAWKVLIQQHPPANLFTSFWRRVKAGQPCGRPGSSQVSPAGGPGQPRSALRAAQVSPGQPCGLTGSSSRQVSPQRAPRVSRVNPQRAPGQACARSMHAEQITSPLFVLGPRPQPRAATDQARTRMAQPIIIKQARALSALTHTSHTCTAHVT